MSGMILHKLDIRWGIRNDVSDSVLNSYASGNESNLSVNQSISKGEDGVETLDYSDRSVNLKKESLGSQAKYSANTSNKEVQNKHHADTSAEKIRFSTEEDSSSFLYIGIIVLFTTLLAVAYILIRQRAHST